MNIFGSKYLLRSKWTSNVAFHDETHFLVTQTLADEKGKVDKVILQGLVNRHCFELEPHELENSDLWRMGWH